MGLLNEVIHPQQIKAMGRQALPQLAEEIRNIILEVVSRNGGHLAASLGAVELAIALHYVFDSPHDKIIWDVGHQAYAHKLLTGRQRKFHTLRQHGGLSGFTRNSESVHDPLTTGHSSTSISAALGMACGRHLSGDSGKVIAVIGDGAMTAGLAYEGINQAGQLQKDLIIILNDNNMSIAPNVGALSSSLSRTFAARRYQEFFNRLSDRLRTLPGIGNDLYHLAKKTKESFKTFVTPGMLFEAFNLEYFGPIDGHNLNHLIDILENLKKMDESTLLHVKTVKGRGYTPAEDDPVFFHGCGPFCRETGCCPGPSCDTPTYTEVFGRTLCRMAANDDRIVVITAAMPEGTGLTEFARRFPERFFDVGIAEQHAVTFAAGLALEGYRPVVAIYSSFLQRAYDQILHDVCIESLPVTFAVDRSGIVGEDGSTHQGLFDLSYLRCLPGMVIAAPKDEDELRDMLATALAHEGPFAVRYPRGNGLGTGTSGKPACLPIGKAEILKTGADVVLLAFGSCVAPAMSAARELSELGIEAAVVNARFAKPFDAETLAAMVGKTPRIVTIEENVLCGGGGSAVLECLADAGLTGVAVRRLGIGDIFVKHGPQSVLRSVHGLDTAAITAAAVKLLEQPSPLLPRRARRPGHVREAAGAKVLRPAVGAAGVRVLGSN